MRKFSFAVLLFSFSAFGQKGTAACEKLIKINALLQREHYKPKPVDDSLSVYVFDTFIDALDPEHLLFTKSEYTKLSQNRLLIDDAIRGNNCGFFDDLAQTYRKALQRKKSIIEKIAKLPLDYNSKDSVRFSRKSFPFDLAETDLERVWRKRIRYEILEEIAGMSSNLDSLKQHFASIEKIVRPRIFETNLCKINSLFDDADALESNMQNELYNAFCSWFDPHSNYFTLDAKSSFMSGLSTSNLSLGLDFEMNEKQEIIVSEVIPGGPAARSEQIQKEDVIVKVSNKKGKGILVSCTTPDAIGELMYSDENKEIVLTVRKKNGALLEVPLEKQLMKAVSNSVYSFIVEKGIRVGYIRIPSFYSDFDNHSIAGCADDVAREIVKLKQDHISGLVIDILDNGGGSMEEAIKLTGMFTDSGPVSILSDNKNNQQVLQGFNTGTVYNGPVVLLVNGNSASASEFFAAALQDYKRAVIAGSTTLGKASMQSILPLDDSNSNKDFVKVTLEKFYRITGESHQRTGIVPDVALPVLFDSIIPREKSFRTALAHDAIPANESFRVFSGRSSEIIAASNERVKSDSLFKEIEAINNEVNSIYNSQKRTVRLTLGSFYADSHKTDALSEKIKAISKKTNNCGISNTTYEKGKLALDSSLKEINDYELADVQHNLYLDEAVNIIRDFKVHSR